MPTSSHNLERALVELAWSHWTALGVSGWRLSSRGAGARDDVAIDPEALILLTAALGSVEPRLRDEATDWCVAFGRYVSKVRLKNLLRFDVADQSAFTGFAATVNRHAHAGWPDAGARPRAFEPTLRSELVVRGAASTIRLRARLVFGVSARAEIVVLLASDPDRGSSASDLAERASYGRRNVVEALDALVRVGIVREIEARGARRYALADRGILQPLLGPIPSSLIVWGGAFKACSIALRTLQTYDRASPLVRSVEAAKAAELIGTELQLSELSAPEPPPTRGDAWDGLGPWALQFVERLRDPSRALGRVGAEARSESSSRETTNLSRTHWGVAKR